MRTLIVLLLAAAVTPPADSLDALWERLRHADEPEHGSVASLDDQLGPSLWKAARARRPIGDAIAEVASRYKIRRETASSLVEATLIALELPDMYGDEKADPARLDRVHAALWKAYEHEPAAEIVLHQAGWLIYELGRDPALDRRVIEELRRSSDPAPLAARIAWLGVCEEDTREAGLAIALQHRPSHPALLLAMAEIRSAEPCASAAWAGQALEAAATRGLSDRKFLAKVRNRYLAALLTAARSREAVDAYKAIPPAERDAALAATSEDEEKTLDALIYQVATVALRPSLAAAAFLVGEGDLARTIIGKAGGGESAEIIRSAIEQLRSDKTAEAFDPLERAIGAIGGSPEARLPQTLLLAKLAQQAGYPAMAKELVEPEIYRAEHPESGTVPEELLAQVGACRSGTTAIRDDLLKSVAGTTDSPTGPDPAAVLIARSFAAPQASVFAEKPLPGNVVPWDPPEKERDHLESGLEKWKSCGLWPVRVEESGKEVVAVGLSQDYDPAGEVSGGGYWIVRSHDSGKSWERPLYTGLHPMQPYVVRSFSRFPLFAGERIHIEVDIRELDTEAITFPPIDRSFKRERTGLFLDAAWADLARDRDGDGLADLAEERLMTDPLAADSDGDGIGDATDRLPHIPRSAATSARAAALAAFLKVAADLNARPILTGEPGGQGADAVALTSEATTFIVGDRRDFAGLALDRRVIVLSESEADTAHDRFGEHYPARYRLVLDRTGTRAIGVWSESWRGATVGLRLENGVWVPKAVGQWIT